jgi:hypothetical protein
MSRLVVRSSFGFYWNSVLFEMCTYFFKVIDILIVIMNKNQMLMLATGAFLIHLGGYIPAIYGLKEGIEHDAISPVLLGMVGYVGLNGISEFAFRCLRNQAKKYKIENSLELENEVENLESRV